MREVPFIQLDFENKLLMFNNPIEIVTTSSLNDVAHCLNKVERAVESGYYAAGFLSYEASKAFNPHFNVKNPSHIPLLWFGIFTKPITSSHLLKEQSYHYKDWKLSITKNQFNDAFHHINNYIKNGHISQINYTTQYETHFSGDTYSYYNDLKNAQQANYSAYIHTDNFDILSASPELFFKVENNIIKMKPMKGTIDRGLTYDDDIKKKKWLEQSDKNKYENKLTTKLMYEELKQITKNNSISIYDRYKVAQYPTVFQMTSTIEGTLRPNTTLFNIFKAVFPCGSITGVPKQAAMDLISNLETNDRNVYCGAIGYITPKKKAIFNVPIRTVVVDNKLEKATYGVGGAITENSTVQEEFNEIKTKAKILQKKQPTFELLETLGLINGKYIVFDNHINRLKRSAIYFNFNINLDDIKKALLLKSEEYARGDWRVRLLVSKNGSFTIEVHPLNHIGENLYVKLAEKPLQKNNPFLYHKTTYRDIYDQFKMTDDQFFDVLLWNEEKEITEFTIGNIVVKLNGELLTPPVESGLLAGTYREKLLQESKIKERKIYVDDLKKCSQIWFINSVRKWTPVKLIN